MHVASGQGPVEEIGAGVGVGFSDPSLLGQDHDKPAVPLKQTAKAETSNVTFNSPSVTFAAILELQESAQNTPASPSLAKPGQVTTVVARAIGKYEENSGAGNEEKAGRGESVSFSL